ncbi:MAG: hypothetical protein PHT69_02225 [Bacteroidales bacterium]|nr:hypothetical protein [Bacteroidales bacterium]
MRKPTTIKAEIAENREMANARGIDADVKAMLEQEIADLEKELENALKAETKKPAATKKAAPKKKTAAKKKTTGKKKTATKASKPKEKKFVMVGDEKVFEDDPKFCEIIIDKWKARKEAIKKAAGKRKTKSVIQRAAADVADAVSKGIRNFKVDEIKKDPKKAIAKMEKLEKAGKEFIDAYKDIIGEKITQKEIKEEFEGLDKAIKQISDKYLKEKQKMAKGGETDMVKVSIKDIELIDEGDSAKVFSDKNERDGETGIITKIHGLKYTLKFKDGKKEDFHQSQLEFYKEKQKMEKGGETNSIKPLEEIKEEIGKLSFKPAKFIVRVAEDAYENTGDPYNLDTFEFDSIKDAYEKYKNEVADIKTMNAQEVPDYKQIELQAWDEDMYEMEILADEGYDVSYEDDYGKLVIQYQHVGKGMNYAHKFIGLFFLDEYTEKDISNNPDKMFSTWTNILDITEEDLSGLTYDEAVEKIKDEANLKLQNNITLDDIIDAIDIIDEDEDEQED